MIGLTLIAVPNFIQMMIRNGLWILITLITLKWGNHCVLMLYIKILNHYKEKLVAPPKYDLVNIEKQI
jgi:hypothetical protein